MKSPQDLEQFSVLTSALHDAIRNQQKLLLNAMDTTRNRDGKEIASNTTLALADSVSQLLKFCQGKDKRKIPRGVTKLHRELHNLDSLIQLVCGLLEKKYQKDAAAIQAQQDAITSQINNICEELSDPQPEEQ